MSETASERKWHVMAVQGVAEALLTDQTSGLSEAEATRRLAEHGRNELRRVETTPRWKMFVAQFNDFMIWVLAVAVLISALEGEVVDAVAITAILVLNGVLGFVQEYRAEQAMEALRQLAAPTATIVREGKEKEIPAAELVPGDIVLLASGDHVPADGRLVEVGALRVDEASLTGESVPVHKHPEPVMAHDAPLGDRVDMVFAGTPVLVGRGRFIVTETGQSTQMGRIAEMLASQVDEKTPLQRELKTVGQRIALLVLAVAAIVFAVGVWQAWQAVGGTLSQALAEPAFRSRLTVALLVAISLAVAAIPEGLPAIVTISLSLGVRVMAARNAIVKKLHAVETLGSTTYICSDKTGTITRNEMTVRRLLVGRDLVHILPDWAEEPADHTPDPADERLLLEIAASANDAHVTAEGALVGDPTETALVVAADRLEERGRIRPRRLGEVPFDSERKRMTTVHARDDARVAYMKGGPDVVLGLCTEAQIHGEVAPMTEDLLAELRAANELMASEGFRTLAVACRELTPDEPNEGEQLEVRMRYVGIIGMVDPPRAEVPAAIETCKRAGMHVVMITGDHALTARAIATEIGLGDGEAITGRRLEHMSDDELFAAVKDARIYARVNPADKLRIVDALKRHGEVVAMTGDGVNDAPALKRADIGVAMGRIGTDVSREAADMVLSDDNFATIVEAVRQGRIVFDNLRKSILFLLSCNVSEVLIVFTTTFFSPIPVLLPLQLLWINLVTDGLPALALGVDPGAPDIMDRSPRRPDEGILARRRQAQVVWQGALLTLAGLLVYFYSMRLMPGGGDPVHARTMLFTAMVLTQLLHAFDFRSDTRTVFSAESFRNRWLILALVGSMSLQMLVLYTPFLRPVFSTVPLNVTEWAVVVIAALVPIAVIDLVKAILARRSRGTIG